MGYEVAYNPLDVPVVVDDEGRVLGGREWGAVDGASAAARRAFGIGNLVRVPAAENAQGEAARAFERARDLGSRSEAFGGMTREELAQVAFDAGLIADPDEPPTKSELVAMLAPRDRVKTPTRPTPPRPPRPRSAADTDKES